MSNKLTLEEENKIIDKLYAMQDKECKEYTEEEADFVMKCLYMNNNRIKREAENTLTLGIKQYIELSAIKLIQSKSALGSFSPQDIEDVQQAGFEAFAGQFKRFIPNSGTKLTSFITHWTDEAMNDEIDNILNHTNLTESQSRINAFIGATKPLLQSRGIEHPTSQDYFQIALEQGKDTVKYYNLTNIERALNSTKGYKGRSMEELADNGFLAHNDYDVLKEVEDREAYNELISIINKLAYFDKKAIESKIEAFELCKDEPDKKHDARTMYFNAYKIFKKKTGISDISQRDFNRLLADATNELNARRNVKPQSKKYRTYINNSLDLDDSFDSLFGNETEVSSNDINITLNIEFNLKYGF